MTQKNTKSKDVANNFSFKDMKQYKTSNSFDFFSQGSYGCVTYPRIRCDNGRKDTRNKRSISKLTTKTFYTENEYKIGTLLKKIKQELTEKLNIDPSDSKSREELEIMEYFNNVESKCEVKKEKLKINKRKHNCKVINKEDAKVVLMKAKYIDSEEINDYLMEHFSVKLLIKYYYIVLSCMKVLHNHHIVHHDLHLGNVLIDKSDDFHLIDFGIAIHVPSFYHEEGNNSDFKTLNFTYMRKILLNLEPSWRFWSMEYHILAFYAFKEMPLDNKSLMVLIDKYFDGDNKEIFGHYFGRIADYKQKCFEFYSEKYVNDDPYEKHCRYIIDNASFSWDIYQVNYIMLYLLKIYKISYADSLIDLLKTGLHYDFERRHDAEYYLVDVLSISQQHSQLHESMFEMNKAPVATTKEDFQVVSKSSYEIVAETF